LKAIFLAEVVQFGPISQVEALGEEGVDGDVVPPDQLLQGVAEADLGRDHVVLHEVVRYLEVLQLRRVVALYRELKVKHWALLVRVLVPATLDQRLPQRPVTPTNYEDLDVVRQVVLLAEYAEVRYRLLLLFGLVPCQEFFGGTD
jgi:hypothetical protein